MHGRTARGKPGEKVFVPAGAFTVVLARIPPPDQEGASYSDLQWGRALPPYRAAVSTPAAGVDFVPISEFVASEEGRQLVVGQHLVDFERRVALLNGYRSGDVLLFTRYPNEPIEYGDYLGGFSFRDGEGNLRLFHDDSADLGNANDPVARRAEERLVYWLPLATNHGSPSGADSYVTFITASPGLPSRVLDENGSVRRAVTTGIAASRAPGTTLDLVPILERILKAED